MKNFGVDHWLTENIVNVLLMLMMADRAKVVYKCLRVSKQRVNSFTRNEQVINYQQFTKQTLWTEENQISTWV